jgi:hypothetical protein
MSFKFLRGEEQYRLQLEPIQQLTLTRPTFTPENVEFCFQFGDEEPVVFATGPNQCNITINPTRDGSMMFNNNGNVFKLFARERQNG